MSDGINILILDDEEAIRDSMTRLLSLHYTVFPASSPADAKQILDEEQINICVIDQNLRSDMTGLEFAEFIKIYHSPMKVIMLTGEQDSRLVINALNSNSIDSFLSKPFDYKELRGFIERNLNDAQEKEQKLEEIIGKIRRGEIIDQKDIKMISDDVTRLEGPMFNYRITGQETPDEHVKLLSFIIFDSEDICYIKRVSPDFQINDEFMFRGLIISLTQLSEDLFKVSDDGKMLDEIKLPNVHGKVFQMDNDLIGVIFLSGEKDLPKVMLSEINDFFQSINRIIDRPVEDEIIEKIDEELSKLHNVMLQLQ